MASRALCSSAPPNGVVCGGVWWCVVVCGGGGNVLLNKFIYTNNRHITDKIQINQAVPRIEIELSKYRLII